MPKIIKKNIRVRFIGDISVFDQEIRMKIAESQSESKEFTGLNLNIAINYGGDEICMPRSCWQKRRKAPFVLMTLMRLRSSRGCIQRDSRTDLVIRPSGEYRLSNFMVGSLRMQNLCS